MHKNRKNYADDMSERLMERIEEILRYIFRPKLTNNDSSIQLDNDDVAEDEENDDRTTDTSS
jgi:hypothetical protein